MMNSEDNSESHVGELLSGYLDGELTQQHRQRVELHLADCAVCRSNLQDLESLRRRMGQARLATGDADYWRETMDDPTVRVTRGIGWVLVLGAALILLGFAAFQFLVDPGVTLFWKALICAFYLGLGALFVSVLRQRLIERKTDRYKDVEI